MSEPTQRSGDTASQVETHDKSLHITGAPGNAIVVQIDKDAGKQMLSQIIGAFWWSSFWSSIAALGLLVVTVAYLAAARDARVVEDEVMRLRAAMQAADLPIPDQEH